MKESEIIKYIDLLFNDIKDFNLFSINNILFDIIKPNERDNIEVERFRKIEKEVKIFGLNNDLFIKYNDNGWFSLTDKGKEMKKSNLKFEKFNKKFEKKPMTKFEKLSLLLIALPIIINLIQWDYSSNLKLQLDACNSELDSLNNILSSRKNIMIENKESKALNIKETKKESLSQKK